MTYGLLLRVVAEIAGSAWLLLCGCGTAVLAAGFPVLGVGFLGIALAWGLGMVTAGQALGRHALAGFTPVMAVGAWAAGNLSGRYCLLGIAAQVTGSLLAAGGLYVVVSQIPSFDVHMGFAGNGYETLSPGGFPLPDVLFAEAVAALFLALMVQSGREPVRWWLAGGVMMLTVMLTITLDNAAVSPARSLAMAVFAGGEWLGQVWVFWLAPLFGALVGGWLSRSLSLRDESDTVH
ncbi:aquaporin [Citrobacter freundii]|uniref:aquaporin n=1 Tax=Klebsiella TaxID=570 RepID=UPI000575B384|nr:MULTISPECIES: aquaporin [Klebsiella]EGT0627978.1 aquaporin [Citrobacter freundii]KHM32372.1 hypothetical protein KV34_13360 [Klebsiella aerogenes]